MPAPFSAPARPGWRASLLFLFCLAALIASCSEPTPPPLPPPPVEPDTTTQRFAWDIQYFGDGQSAFYDVYALNDTLAFAVGRVEKDDSIGTLHDEYNAARWDGKRWTLKKVFLHYPTDSSGNTNSLRIVWGDTPTGFLFSEGGTLLYYDLRTVVHDFWFYSRGISFNAIWGPQSNRYFVGLRGTVEHGTGRIYTPENSPTTLDLTDVWGNDQEIWAVGGWSGSQETVRMRRWNGVWTSMDSVIAPLQPSTYTVWCDEKGLAGGGFVACAGIGLAYFDSTAWKTLPSGILEGRLPGTGRYNAVRGTARNNVFAAGDWGVVVHFNGRRWKCMTELITYPSGRLIGAIAVTKNKVFLVGQSNDRGFIITGTRIP